MQYKATYKLTNPKTGDIIELESKPYDKNKAVNTDRLHEYISEDCAIEVAVDDEKAS